MSKSAEGKAYLVGSVGLDTVQDVFATVGGLFGKSLPRVPDGEPGGRKLWVSWQYPLLRASPYLRQDPSGALRATSKVPLLCLAEGVDESEVHFGELGYAREARASYLDFQEAKKRGELAPDARFQVSLPTPVGVIYAFCTAPDVVPIEAAYEAAMLREVQALCAGIPNDDLTIQWDVCHELILLDGRPQTQFPQLKASLADITDRLVRLANAVPAKVELGFHLCYGDFGAAHFFDPVDAGKMVELVNAFAPAVKRRIDYIHFPVPKPRDDEAYFAPLANLQLKPETEIYLGRLHVQDGVEGAQRRAKAARKYVPSFGLATECGIARARQPAVVRQTLELYRDSLAAIGAGT
jgi:hypothetical protein